MNIPKIYYNTTPLNIPEMDTDHDNLMLILNKLSDLVFNKTKKNEIIALLNTLIETVILHFSREESLINMYSSREDMSAHLKQHSEALTVLLSLKNRLELDLIKYQIQYKSDMSNFLDHLLEYDYKLSLAMKEKDKDKDNDTTK